MRDETIRKLMAATSAGVISAALMATPASAQRGRDRGDAGSFAQGSAVMFEFVPEIAVMFEFVPEIAVTVEFVPEIAKIRG
jgi:hypothetical protein